MSLQEKRDRINNLILEADYLLKDGNEQEAFEIFKQAIQLSKEIDWQERVLQIEQMIEDYKKEKMKREEEEKWKLELEQKEEEERKKQKQLEEARMRLYKKKEEEKKAKLEALMKKKKEEEKATQKAYGLLGDGSKLIKNKEFREGIEKIKQALNIFKKYKWPTEIRRAEEILEDSIKAQDEYKKKIEQEKKQKEKLKETYKEHEENLEKSAKVQIKKDEKNKEKLLKNEEQKQLEKKLSEEAFSLLDKGNLAFDKNNFMAAIKNYKKAADLFNTIGWISESQRVRAQIINFKKKQDEYEKQQEKLRKIQEEHEKQKKDLERKINLAKTARERKAIELVNKQKEESEDFENKQRIANEIYRQLDEVEKLVRNYESEFKKTKNMELEPPYQKAAEIYKQCKTQFELIGWKNEATHLNEGIQYYQKKIEQYKKLKEEFLEQQERKKIEEEEFRKQIAQAQSEKRVSQKVITAQLKKIKREKEIQNKIHQECMNLLDDAQKYYNRKDFEKAYEIYERVLEKYQSIDYLDGIKLMKESIHKVKEEIEKKKIEEEIKKKTVEEKEKEKAELEAKIREAKTEYEKKLLEEKKKILEEKTRKEKEQKIQNQIITLLEKAGKLTDNRKFDEAIKTYKEALSLLPEINWPLKDIQIKDAIKDTLKKKAEYEQKEKLLEEKRKKEEERRKIEQELYKKQLEKEKKEERRRKQLILQQQKQKMTEKELGDEAWNLLDKGEAAVKQKQYYYAIHYFRQAFANFSRINWKREAQTTKTRIKQIYTKIEKPIIDLGELLDLNKYIETKNILKDLQAISRNILLKKFQHAREQLIDWQKTIQNKKWVKSFNLLQEYLEYLDDLEKKYLQEQDEKAHLPTIDNGQRLFNHAIQLAENGKFIEAQKIGNDALNIFIQLNSDRDINRIKQELARWKFKSESITEQLRKITKINETKKDNITPSTDMDERQKRIEERKRKRREERKKRKMG